MRTLFTYTENRVTVLARGVGGIQQPKIFARRDDNSFFIGQVLNEDRPLIPYSPEKPVILRAQFQQAAPPVDTLKLTPLVNAGLKDMFMATTARGASPFVFINDDDFPDAFQVSGSYKSAGDSLTVDVYLVKGDTQKRFTVSGAASDLPGLARQIVKKAVEAIGEE